MGLLLNRVKAACNAAGTGAVTPGTAVSPYQSWSAAGAVSGGFYDYLIEQGAAWEMGVGLYNGTTITRPGPGVDPLFTSSTGSLLTVTASDTIACVANKCTYGVAGAFLPGNIPDLVYCFDSAAMGLKASSGYPIPVMSNFTPWMAAWGFGASGTGVTVDSSTLNGHAVLNAANSSNGRYGAGSASGSILHKSTHFVVFNPNAVSANQEFTSGLTNSLSFRINSSAKIELVKTFVANVGNSSGSVSAATWYQANATYDDSTGNYAFRIGRSASGSGSNVQSITAANDSLFYSHAGANEDLNSKIAFLAYYARVLTTTEIGAVETYLNQVYGV